MHDCRIINEKLIDLIFEEIGEVQKQLLQAEIAGCASCSDHYQSMTRALHAFDQAAEAAAPAESESFWMGYEARLRTKLIGNRPFSFRERIEDYFGGVFARLRMVQVVAVGLALLIVGLASLFVLRGTRESRPPLDTAQQTSPHQDSTNRSGVAGGGTPNESRENHPPTQASPGTKKQRTKNLHQPDVDIVAAEIPAGFGAERFVPQVSPPVSPADEQINRHFERAQLVLRTFKNLNAGSRSAVPQISYERDLSRRLVYQNILLRRAAHASGNLPAEQLLSSLELLLLDIANLPEGTKRGEIEQIQNRIQNKEILGALQVYSARTMPPLY